MRAKKKPPKPKPRCVTCEKWDRRGFQGHGFCHGMLRFAEDKCGEYVRDPKKILSTKGNDQ